MQAAADTDRAQLPHQVAELVDRHERARAQLRADYRAYTAARSAYDLAAELPTLRAEIDFLDIVGRQSAPATGYPTLADSFGHLDEAHRQVVSDIAGSLQAVQSLHLYPGADKPAALGALAATAKCDCTHRALALPATPQAVDYAANNRYADTTSGPDHAVAKLQTGRWKLPLGSLVIVDDADHLKPDQLSWLAQNAADTNTKLLLITMPDHRKPDHTLTAALDHLVPWAQHLGSPDRSHQRPLTAIERTEHYRATAKRHTGPERQTVRKLLLRRDQLLDHFRETADIAAQFEAAAATHAREHGRDHGVEL